MSVEQARGPRAIELPGGVTALPVGRRRARRSAARHGLTVGPGAAVDRKHASAARRAAGRRSRRASRGSTSITYGSAPRPAGGRRLRTSAATSPGSRSWSVPAQTSSFSTRRAHVPLPRVAVLPWQPADLFALRGSRPAPLAGVPRSAARSIVVRARVIWRLQFEQPDRGGAGSHFDLVALARGESRGCPSSSTRRTSSTAPNRVAPYLGLGLRTWIVLRTLSKAFGFAGPPRRLCRLLGRGRARAERARRAPGPVASPSARIAAAALREPAHRCRGDACRARSDEGSAHS